MWIAPMLARPVRTASRRPGSGSMNTDTAARPSEYTTWPTGFDSPMRRLSSMILWNPGSSAESPQPVRCAGDAAASSPPAARRVARLHHVAGDIADRKLREHELLDALPGGVESDRLEQHAARHVGVQPVAVAQVVLGREHHRLAIEAGDAPRLAQADVVVARES